MRKNTEAVLVTPGTMCIQEAPVPVPKADEVLIRVEYVGICGSDVHGFQFGPFIPPKDPNQKIGLGHECAGTVVEVGEKITNFKVGDRVCLEPGVPCGKCKFCLSGHYNICPDVDFLATQPNYRGALTNYMTHPAAWTYHLPENMDFMEGALVEPAAVGMHAATEGGACPGKKIVILGAGCIGLMTLQACRSFGATEIVVVDVMDKRLEAAKRFGAMAVVNGMTEDTVTRVHEILGDWGADIVFETAGSSVTTKQTTALVTRGGRIMVVGTVSDDTPINFLKINREVSIQTVFRYANIFPKAIAAVASGAIKIDGIVSREYDLDHIEEAYNEAVNNKTDLLKVVIKMR